MNASEESLAALEAFFRAVAPHLVESLSNEIDPSDLQGLNEEANLVFDQLLPEIPYVNNPDHTMAQGMFYSAAVLAFLEPIRARGRDVHCLGRAAYDFSRRYSESISGEDDPMQRDDARLKSAREAIESQATGDPREFVWETVEGDNGVARGINIKSCAICHLFGAHDAMELVPYLCAADDLTSDAYNSGLRRTSTIALGAHQCDFLPVRRYPAS